MSEIPNDALMLVQVQQELIRYLDIRLEQLELLLCRMDRLARQAAADTAKAQERRELQQEVILLRDEIDKIAEKINGTYL